MNLKTAEMCSSRDSLKHFCVIYFAVREGDVTRGEGGGEKKNVINLLGERNSIGSCDFCHAKCGWERRHRLSSRKPGPSAFSSKLPISSHYLSSFSLKLEIEDGTLTWRGGGGEEKGAFISLL